MTSWWLEKKLFCVHRYLGPDHQFFRCAVLAQAPSSWVLGSSVELV